MATIFNRSAELIIGQPGQEGRDFSGLRIQFQIEKTSESNSNTSRITIFNLNRENRAFVEQENLDAFLSAGYTPQGQESLVEAIFQGDIKKGKVENKLSGSDWQTTFEVGDGERALVETKFNKSFAKGANLEAVIGEVAESFEKPISTIKGIKNKVFKNGLTLSGSSKDIMDQLSAEAEVEFSIQDDEVVVLPANEDDGEESQFISRDTGLIGSPIKREKGIEFVSALNPKLRPGRKVRIESKFINGDFRIRKVVHDGDTHEGPWQSKCEAVNL